MKRLLAGAAGVLAATIAGCGGARTNLLEAETVPARIGPTPKVCLSSVSARQDGDQLLVSGVVKPQAGQTSNVYGHVDVAVAGPDAKLLDGAAVPYFPKNLLSAGRGKRDSRFVAQFAPAPPTGSTVYAVYHNAVLAAEGGPSPCAGDAAARLIAQESRSTL